MKGYGSGYPALMFSDFDDEDATWSGVMNTT